MKQPGPEARPTIARLRLHTGVLGTLLGLLLVTSGRAEVRVFIEDNGGVVGLQYECTAGEVVRAFALDVLVDHGQITNVSGFFRGPSRVGATGYGIFPASFRDNFTVAVETNIDWEATNYTPLASSADLPTDTLPGLNSAGVTLELGGLWDPTVPETIPGPTGALCALALSQPATVSVRANVSRGGVVSAFPGSVIQPVFFGAFVGGPSITSATLQNGLMTILFSGGELQTAFSVNGPWNDTGDISGNHIEALGTNQMKFYRVRKL
jgi:hypothetical protein